MQGKKQARSARVRRVRAQGHIPAASWRLARTARETPDSKSENLNLRMA